MTTFEVCNPCQARLLCYGTDFNGSLPRARLTNGLDVWSCLSVGREMEGMRAVAFNASDKTTITSKKDIASIVLNILPRMLEKGQAS